MFITKEQIIGFDIDSVSFDNLTLFCAELHNIEAILSSDKDLKVPEWLIDKRNEADQELTGRIRSEKKRRLRLLQTKRESLLPDDVKLKNVDSEIDSLKKELEQ